MNEILENRLNQCNIKVSDILNCIEQLNEKKCVLVYTSHLEGLGTEGSDFDIYVISDDESPLLDTDYNDKPITRIAIVNGQHSMDIEYWDMRKIDKIIDSVNLGKNSYYDMDELKLLHRLKISEAIYGFEITSKVKKEILNSKLNDRILKNYVALSNTELRNGINLYNSNEYICALKCMRESLEYAVGALNSKAGNTNLKNKWIPKIFIMNNGYEDALLKKYLKMQAYSNIDENNISVKIEEMAEFIQDILSKVAI